MRTVGCAGHTSRVFALGSRLWTSHRPVVSSYIAAGKGMTAVASERSPSPHREPLLSPNSTPHRSRPQSRTPETASATASNAATPSWLGKAFYFTSMGGSVFLFPLINLFLRDLGASDSQIGILSALRPWLGMASTFAGPMLADRYKCHRELLVMAFLMSTALRSAMWLVKDNLVHVAVLLLLADFLGGPVGPMSDSMVLASCKKETDYGRQRLWGSVGWGLCAPVAGWMVQQSGMGAGFAAYTLMFLPAMAVTMQFRHPHSKPSDDLLVVLPTPTKHTTQRPTQPDSAIRSDSAYLKLPPSSPGVSLGQYETTSTPLRSTESHVVHVVDSYGARSGVRRSMSGRFLNAVMGLLPFGMRRRRGGSEGASKGSATVPWTQEVAMTPSGSVGGSGAGEGSPGPGMLTQTTPQHGPAVAGRDSTEHQGDSPSAAATPKSSLPGTPIPGNTTVSAPASRVSSGASDHQGLIHSLPPASGRSSVRSSLQLLGMQMSPQRQSAAGNQQDTSGDIELQQHSGGGSVSRPQEECGECREPSASPYRQSPGPSVQTPGRAVYSPDEGVGSSTGAKSSHHSSADAATQASGTLDGHHDFWKELHQLLAQPPVWRLLLQALASGFGAGLVGTYQLLFAHDIGATATLMGLMLTFDCLAETPVFFFQGQLLTWMTPTTLLHVSLGATVLRFMLYASLPMVSGCPSWAILPIELLQGLTLAAAWGSMCVLCKQLAPPSLQTTLQGTTTAVFGGLGGGLGGLVGGMLRQADLGWSATWGGCAMLVVVLWTASVALVPRHTLPLSPAVIAKRVD